MKVVIDTSVWISALIKKNSKSREILKLVFTGKLLPQISEALFREYESITTREDIQSQTILTKDEQQELFEAFLSQCCWNDIYYSWRPNLKDENDNFLVELAVASGAKTIITYNTKDFKNSQLIFNYKVLTPEEFINKETK